MTPERIVEIIQEVKICHFKDSDTVVTNSQKLFKAMELSFCEGMNKKSNSEGSITLSREEARAMLEALTVKTRIDGIESLTSCSRRLAAIDLIQNKLTKGEVK